MLLSVACLVSATVANLSRTAHVGSFGYLSWRFSFIDGDQVLLAELLLSGSVVGSGFAACLIREKADQSSISSSNSST